MKPKAECENAIRHLCLEWAKEKGFVPSSDYHASFSEFKNWLGEKGYSSYLYFRTSTSADYDAEMWFDEEMKQLWRR